MRLIKLNKEVKTRKTSSNSYDYYANVWDSDRFFTNLFNEKMYNIQSGKTLKIDLKLNVQKKKDTVVKVVKSSRSKFDVVETEFKDNSELFCVVINNSDKDIGILTGDILCSIIIEDGKEKDEAEVIELDVSDVDSNEVESVDGSDSEDVEKVVEEFVEEP